MAGAVEDIAHAVVGRDVDLAGSNVWKCVVHWEIRAVEQIARLITDLKKYAEKER